MQRLVNVGKLMVFVIALVAIVCSLGPLSAQPAEENKDDGNTLWSVTCTYDGNGTLLSRVCQSGGSHSCAC